MSKSANEVTNLKPLPKWVEKANAEQLGPWSNVEGDPESENVWWESKRSFEAGARLVLDRLEKTREKDYLERYGSNDGFACWNTLKNEGRESVRREILGE